MEAQRMHVLVVGGGIVGLATAWALARAGHRVEIFDQGPLPNSYSASYDQNRLIRQFYPDRPGYCRLVDEAHAAWERLWAATGRSHYKETGVLAVSTTSGDWADRARRTMDEVGQPYERLEGTEIARRWAFLALPTTGYAIRTRRGGVLFAERIVTDMVALLARLQVARHANSRIAALDERRGEIRLADGTAKTADAIVLAGGAWTARLVPDMAERLTTTRNVVLYLEPPVRHLAGWATAPSILDLGGSEGIYAIPPVGGTDLKFAISAYARPADPDKERQVAGDEPLTLLGRLRSNLTDAGSYRIKGSRACFYTMAPEERFILERRERLWLVSACSGHGFKFGALTGELVAEAVSGTGDAEAIARRLAGH
jgi:sarcosine oxidase